MGELSLACLCRVLLLHFLGFFWVNFVDLVRFFNLFFKTFAVILRGFGVCMTESLSDSSCPFCAEAYSILRFLNDSLELINCIGGGSEAALRWRSFEPSALHLTALTADFSP